jgi:hypothetical protein
MVALKFTICSVYLAPRTAVSLAYLQDLLLQLLARLLLLGDFNAQHHLWGSVDEDERGRVIETLISRGNLVVLNVVEPTHTYLLPLVTSLVLTLPCAVLRSLLASHGGYLMIFAGVTISQSVSTLKCPSQRNVFSGISEGTLPKHI